MKTRALIFDPFSGASGDMILGALLEVGLSEDWLRELIAGLPVSVRLEIQHVNRGALRVRSVTVRPEGDEPARHLADVLEIIDRGRLTSSAREWATAAFRLLAEVEGDLHGRAPDQVHFHEVGAADSIVDVVGACAGVAALGVDRCFTRSIAVGRGWVDSQHGRLPVPAPATQRLLEGLPTCETDLEGELTTPTGAVLLSVLTAGQRAPGSYRPIASGYGAGARDPATHPNCLRVILAELETADELLVLQTDIDDMSPEYVPPLLEAALAAGALDVWTYPLYMKKGRTGLRVETLVPSSLRPAVSRVLLQESTSLGLRFWPVERETLPRTSKTIEWRGVSIRVKVSITPDGHIRQKAEYDDVLQAARTLGVPVSKAREEIERELGEGDGERD